VLIRKYSKHEQNNFKNALTNVDIEIAKRHNTKGWISLNNHQLSKLTNDYENS
jgi:hypothetical protein